MNFIKRKILPGILVAVLFISMIPLTALGTTQSFVANNEEEILNAIAAIEVGGSGEITIEDRNIVLNNGIYFEYKDITFNLINSQLVTNNLDEFGQPLDYGRPVIFGYGANITINADENSSMQTGADTGMMGVVAMDNSTEWDAENKKFEKDFNLTINGGAYFAAEGDLAFRAAPGTKVTLTNVECYAAVEPVDYEGVGIDVPGELVINSGVFTNDIRAYAAAGKFSCNAGHKYYVRDKEYTDEFNKALTNGKVVFNYAKPVDEFDEKVYLVAEDFSVANPGFYIMPDGFVDDYSKVEVTMYPETVKEEIHTVDVVWDYDADTLKAAQSIIEKFPEDRPWFNVTDLELVNYWAYSNPDSETGTDTLANYSGELKSYLNNTNFSLPVEVGAGADEPFYTERVGYARLMHDGKVYHASTFLGARAEHAIYVPESTADTKEALIAAAQKRIKDYIGKDIAVITAADETVTDYYNNTVADYDAQLAAAREIFDRESAKAENERDWNAYWSAKSDVEYIPMYKQYFIDQFSEGGDLHFLNNAAGDFFFNLQVNGQQGTKTFVIIKDDDKLAVPTYATVDLETKVEVKTDSSAIPLDTAINVEKLTEGENYEKIMETLGVQDAEMFDINLRSDSLGKNITKLENGKFEVRIPIPEKFEGEEDLIVYYVDSNNKVTDYVVKPEGNYATFTTDHFSIYTLAVDETHAQHQETNKTSPDTGVRNGWLLWLAAAFVCGAAGTFAVCKTVKER